MLWVATLPLIAACTDTPEAAPPRDATASLTDETGDTKLHLPTAPEQAVLAAADDFAAAISAAQSVPPEHGERLRAAVEPLLRHLDLPEITRLLLGRPWASASDEERGLFQDALVDYLSAQHASALRDLRDWRLELKHPPIRRRSGNTARVSVAISARGAPTLPIELHLRWRDDAWRLYDATLFDVGAIGLLRPELSRLAAERGVGGLTHWLAQPDPGGPSRLAR